VRGAVNAGLQAALVTYSAFSRDGGVYENFKDLVEASSVGAEELIAAVDALKQVITNLGFGGGALKLLSGSGAIEFIREGRTLLAVQTDGGFAPGVRETLIIVTRELSR
jgi:hypothetical protein